MIRPQVDTDPELDEIVDRCDAFAAEVLELLNDPDALEDRARRLRAACARQEAAEASVAAEDQLGSTGAAWFNEKPL